MAVKYKVCTIESERGWGQKCEYAHFNTAEEAIKYRDYINSFNKPVEKGESVPDWYMYAEKEISVVEVN